MINDQFIEDVIMDRLVAAAVSTFDAKKILQNPDAGV